MKSVILLSGGMDSAVNLYEAHSKGSILLALTFNYGQRAASREMQSSRALAKNLQVPHEVVELPFFKNWGHSSLTNPRQKLPLQGEVAIDDLEISRQTAKSVWVPNRNGIFLNIAAGFAEALGAQAIVPGFNLEEASTFPDNSFEFMGAMTRSLSFSTANQVEVQCFTVNMNKTEIVRRGEQLKVPWREIWPCYQAGERWCGQCESCQRARRAFEANGLKIF
jgi:7-cyano-7-deazaguanine synthase